MAEKRKKKSLVICNGVDKPVKFTQINKPKGKIPKSIFITEYKNRIEPFIEQIRRTNA